MEAGVGAAGPPRDGNGRERRGRRKKTQYLPRRLPAAPAPGQMRKRSRALAFIRGPPRDTITRPWFRIYTTGPQTRLTHTPATQTPVGWLRGPVSWLVLSPPPPNNQTTTAGFCNVCARVYCGYEPVTGGENPDGGCGSGRAPYPPYSSIPRASVNICSNSKSAISRAP